MPLVLLAACLGAASTFDIMRGSVPILLLAAIPLLGAIDIACAVAPHDWLWRCLDAVLLIAIALLAGPFGGADLFVIGSAAFWLAPPGRAPELPGLFLAAGGLLGIYWTMIWRRFGNPDWARPEDPEGAVPMLPPLSASLFLFAAFRG